MKTQMNKFQTEQTLNNTLMLISILVLGTALFIVSGKNFWANTFKSSEASFGFFNQNELNGTFMLLTDKDDDRIAYNYMASVESDFQKELNQELEIDKINSIVESNHIEVFQYVLDEFNSIKETEYDDRKVVENEVVVVAKESKETSFTSDIDLYLAEMLEKKNVEIVAEIEMENNFANYYADETEEEMEAETWMTSELVWETANNAKSTESYLQGQLAQKNKNISSEVSFEDYLLVDNEESLKVDNWMTDDSNFTKDVEVGVEKRFYTRELAEKSKEIDAYIALSHKAKGSLEIENEEALVLEDWMTTTTTENGVKVDAYLAEDLNSKNNIVASAIDNNRKMEELLALETENELELEGWMKEAVVSVNGTICINPLDCDLAFELKEKNGEIWCGLEMEIFQVKHLTKSSEASLIIEDWMLGEQFDLNNYPAKSKDLFLVHLLEQKNEEMKGKISSEYDHKNYLTARNE